MPLDAYDWLRHAMEWYEQAEALRPPGNVDAVLRWNSCVRASHHARPASAAGGRGARRTITAGIGDGPPSLAKQRELRRGRLVLGDTFI